MVLSTGAVSLFVDSVLLSTGAASVVLSTGAASVFVVSILLSTGVD